MKIKQFRSIFAVATVVTSIAASSLPSQAFTWDDVWGVVKTQVVKEIQPSSATTPSNNESTTSPPDDVFWGVVKTEVVKQLLPSSATTPSNNESKLRQSN
jgi:hypothetical protein